MVHNRRFSCSIVSEIGEPSRVPQEFASPAHVPGAAIGLTCSVPANYGRWDGGGFSLTGRQLFREGGWGIGCHARDRVVRLPGLLPDVLVTGFVATDIT